MTRKEVFAALAEDWNSVQRRTLEGWVAVTSDELDPRYAWLPDNWRLTPRPVPPGDLTWEEAKAAQAAGKKVQWFDEDEVEWRNQIADFTVGHHSIDLKCAWRLKPEPKLVPLGPGDVDLHHDLFRHSAVGPVEDQTIATRKNEKHIFVYDAPVTWEMAMRVLEWSRDAGKSWRPCSKEVAS